MVRWWNRLIQRYFETIMVKWCREYTHVHMIKFQDGDMVRCIKYKGEMMKWWNDCTNPRHLSLSWNPELWGPIPILHLLVCFITCQGTSHLKMILCWSYKCPMGRSNTLWWCTPPWFHLFNISFFFLPQPPTPGGYSSFGTFLILIISRYSCTKDINSCQEL